MTRSTGIRGVLWGAALGLSLIAGPAWANHPVLVEGEQDFDGDGLIGLAEDNDGPAGDPAGLTFGTIGGCLAALNAAINQNGVCQIVTSGNFAEVVSITNQVTIEAAPGVLANIEAFLAPADPRLNEFPAAAADPFALQNAPGVVIDSPDDRFVILRNLVITNWRDGIVIRGDSHVLLENVRVDHNVNNGIVVSGNAEVAIVDSQITSTGFRLNPMTGNFPSVNQPMPGDAVTFNERSHGVIRGSVIQGNFGEAVEENGRADVDVEDSLLFDNEREDDLGGRRRR